MATSSRKYTKVMLEPLSIFIAPDSEYKGLRADEVEVLGAGFRDAVVQTIGPEIPTRPGGQLSWQSIDETLRFYAARFKSRMLGAGGGGE